MPAPAWEDLSVFLNVDEFAVDAVINFSAGGSRSVVGIFDDPYLNAEIGEYSMDNSDPRFLGRESDFAGADRGDTLTIGGVTYDILTGPQSDGVGMSILKLSDPRR